MQTLLLTLLLLHAPVSARSLGVDEAVGLALENSRSIAAAEAGEEKARADERKALLAMFPKLSVMGMYRYTDPLPTMDLSGMMSAFTGGSSSVSCADYPWDMISAKLPKALTADQYEALCEYDALLAQYASAAGGSEIIELGYHNNYTLQAQLDQVIFAGNALRQAHRGSQDLLAASEAQVRFAEHDAAFQAEQSFYQLYFIRQAAQVATEAQNTVDAYVQDLSNVVSVGMGSKADLLAAQAQQSKTRLDAMKAAHYAYIAEVAFKVSLGIPQDQTLDLVLDPISDPSALQADKDAMLAQARQKRPELQALDASLSGMSHFAKASWASWTPTLALSGQYSGQNPNPYTSMLSFGSGTPDWFWSSNIAIVASWTLWDQGAALYGHKAAIAGMNQLQEQRSMLFDMLAVELESAISTYNESVEAIQVARVGLEQATEALRMEQDRFQQGMANNTQLLAAQTAAAGARLALIQAETSLRTAQATLRKAVGTDPEVNP